MKRFNTITSVINTGLITTAVITGVLSIAAFPSVVGLRVGITLSETSLLFFLATAITRRSFKIFTVRPKKYDAIKLLAQSKLDSIADIISQTMQIGDISFTEFYKTLQEVQKYRNLRQISKTNLKSSLTRKKG